MAVDLTQPIKLGSPEYVEQQVIRKLDALGTAVADPLLADRVTQAESGISDIDSRVTQNESDIAGLVSDDAYGSGWNGVAGVAPSKNAVYDKIETLAHSTGSFTPTIQDASLSNAEGQTYTEQTGRYIKIGSLVHYWVDITVNSLGALTPGDQVIIAGMPFTCNSTIRCASTVAIGSSLNISAGSAVSAYVFLGSTNLILNKWSATTGTTLLTVGELSAGGRILIAGSYFTD